MTEREKFKISETKQFCFARDGYRCRSCGGSILEHGSPQLAHRIAATKTNLSRYGKEVIHHPMNLASTCCLRCNGAQNIGFNPAKSEELVEKIKKELSCVTCM